MTKYFFKNYFKIKNKILDKVNCNEIDKLYNLILKVSNNNGKIIVFGNGANISNSAHFATDMTKNGKVNTQIFNDPNLITCFSNDYGFDQWVKKTIEYYCSKKDLVILLSASGESKNLTNAAKYCKKTNIKSASITGFKRNNSLSKKCDLNIWINSKSYNQVEIIQTTILSALVDKKIGKLIYKSNL